LKNDKKKDEPGAKKHSRGVAFVDFKEHQHAIVALRVLNNNPGMLNIVLSRTVLVLEFNF
jgi:RNA recognition motif-containing protein